MAKLSRPFVTGGILVLLGLALCGGGAWLIALGGSSYYAIAGLGFVATGGLLFAGRRAALWVFAAVLVGTLAWALGEVGLDWWPLAARGGVVVIVAIWLLMPWVVRRLGAGGYGAAIPLLGAVAASAAVLVMSLNSTHHDIAGSVAMAAGAPGPAIDDGGMPAGDWRAYGRTQAGQRYSPLATITPQNAGTLVQAWVFRTGDLPGPGDPLETTFEVTPIKAGNSVFLCSQHQRVFALDAGSGKLRWTYDPKVKDNGTFQHLTCRGVAFYEAPTTSGECTRRIFLGTNDARLIALDADLGVPCSAFGQGGTVSLQTGMPVTTLGQYEVTSPPVVTDRLVIVNGSVTDNYSTHEPSGVIRAYDVNTGALVWAWDGGKFGRECNALGRA